VSGIQRTIESDDAAKRGRGIDDMGAVVGFDQCGGNSNTARIGVFDDDAGRCIERFDAFKCRIGIRKIVVGQFLALQETRCRHDALRRIGFNEQRAALMRVLSVTQSIAEGERQMQGLRPRSRLFRLLGTRRKPFGNPSVVMRGVRVGLGRQTPPQRGIGAAQKQGIDHCSVVARINDHRNAIMVFGRGAQHCRPTDINVLDGVFVAAIRLGDGGLERIQIDYQQIDRRDAVLRHDGIIGATAPEQATVDFRVQGLDPTIHDFRKASDVAHFAHSDARLTQRVRRAASGEQFDICRPQSGRKRDQTGFVGYRQERTAEGLQGRGHG
jgi:hypothetical protein